MVIKGDGREIYKDSSNKQECQKNYPSEGADVCSDVIRIAINREPVQELTISTNNYLTLCEVQVFGGKKVLMS